jgi:dihydroneopterin aldolase
MDSKRDFIFVEGLQTRCVIGIFDWERKVRQTVRINLEIPTDVGRAAKRDRIRDAVNYKAISKRVLAETKKSRFLLVESLAEFIAGLVLREFKLREVTVRVSKPGAIRGAKDVGVQVTRTSLRGGRRPTKQSASS